MGAPARNDGYIMKVGTLVTAEASTIIGMVVPEPTVKNRLFIYEGTDKLVWVLIINFEDSSYIGQVHPWTEGNLEVISESR